MQAPALPATVQQPAAPAFTHPQTGDLPANHDALAAAAAAAAVSLLGAAALLGLQPGALAGDFPSAPPDGHNIRGVEGNASILENNIGLLNAARMGPLHRQAAVTTALSDVLEHLFDTIHTIDNRTHREEEAMTTFRHSVIRRINSQAASLEDLTEQYSAMADRVERMASRFNNLYHAVVIPGDHDTEAAMSNEEV